MRSKIIGILISMPLLYMASSFVLEHHSATSVTPIQHPSKVQSNKQASNKEKFKAPAKQRKPAQKPWKTSVVNVSQLSNQQWLQHVKKTKFKAPSDGPYPHIKSWKQIWMDVDISKQRIYIKKGRKTIYTMLTSSGLDTKPGNSTPLGTFHVQSERGKSFYSAQYNEGADYWTSWKNHGEFLFHTVPVNKKGKIIEGVANQLGHKASHGCFHLTFSDAKWIYQNVPAGTKVVIHN